uniref:Uncharacterized protein n=1 Tax=Panagrolaimus sp. PS1159 TaxID=55785 RepID=A0AC35FDA6_9BILA
MNNILSLKDKHKSVSNVTFDASVIGNQYSNLNLNQNFKCSILTPVQSCSKPFNNKNCVRDSAKSDSLELRRNSLSLNKSSKVSNFATFNSESEKGEAKNDWKNESSFSNSTNKSTLSLHIAAYENSIKVKDDLEGSEKMKKLGLIKKWETAKKLFKTSSSIIQNPFEFSRQQESEEIATPEISQFKALQTLLNPNKM